MISLHKDRYTIYISERADGTAREIKDFVYVKQVHGDGIYVLENYQDIIAGEYDGILSKISGIKIGVLVADCNGIVLMGDSWYGIIHAGRKGLKNGILSKAVSMLKNLGEDISSLKIYIGPSIRQCCYEVGEEFLGYFDTKYFKRKDDKIYFDMIAKIRDICAEAGALQENIEINSKCTSCSGDFFSYRKTKTNERFLIAIEKKDI